MMRGYKSRLRIYICNKICNLKLSGSIYKNIRFPLNVQVHFSVYVR